MKGRSEQCRRLERQKREHKSPHGKACLAHSRSSKKTSVARTGAAGDEARDVMWKADLGGPLSFTLSDMGSHWSILRRYDTILTWLLLKTDYRGRGQETSWKLL